MRTREGGENGKFFARQEKIGIGEKRE